MLAKSMRMMGGWRLTVSLDNESRVAQDDVLKVICKLRCSNVLHRASFDTFVTTA